MAPGIADDSESSAMPGQFSHDEIFRVMMLESPLPVSVQDEQWRFVFVNEAYCRYTGYSTEELIGCDPATLLFPPEDDAHLRENRQRAQNAESDLLPEYPSVREMIRKDGQRVRFHVDLSISRTRRGETLWCGVVFDLTYLEETRAKLAEAERSSRDMRFRFDSFAALSSEALLVVDMDADRILHANAPVQTVFGVHASTLVGATIAAIWAHVDPSELEALSAACKQSRTECRHERVVTVNHPEAGVSKVRIRAFRSELPCAETYILAEDITDKMRQAERRLQDALYRQDVLVREVHHRIKNNLQGVIGVLQSARIESDSARLAVNEAIHKINAIAEVNGMLTSGRSEVPISELVKRLSNYLSSAFSASVSVETQVANPAFPSDSFNYDAVPIALVMNEIITNAIKYNDADTAVHVSIKYDEQACVISIFNHGTLASQDVFESIAPNTHGLGLVKALLPPGSTRFSLVQSGASVEATLWLDSTLIKR